MTAIYPDLQDASIFITGGASGIGAALVQGFLAQGSRVAFVDIADANDFVETLAVTHQHPPLYLQCDITDTAALHSAIEEAAA
ncbi:MAG: SDR family NAD(P)-dependent oxidoreductase, partial [Pseudomonadota bacterium]